MHPAVQEATQRHPNIFVAERPRVEVENGVLRIPRDFLQQLERAICFGRKVFVRILLVRECGVEVDAVELLQRRFTSVRYVCEHERMTSEIIHPPELRADIARVQYSFPIAFDQKHDRADAMVRIEQSDAYRPPRRQANDRRSLERNGLEQFLEVLVSLLASFQNPFGEVHTVWVFLQAQQDLLRCWRAVYEGRFAGLQPFEVVGMDMAEEQGQW